MAASKYDQVFSVFLSKITDPKFLSLSNDDAYKLMVEWLHSTVSKPYVRQCFSSLVLDDVVQTFTYELNYPVDEYDDEGFVIEIMAQGMVVSWLEPQVRSAINISQMFGGKEQKFYSQAQHIGEIKGMLKDAKAELRKTIRDHGYINNSYLRSET